MIFPVVGSLPSEMQIARSLGLYDSYLGNFFLKASFWGLYYLVFFEMFKGVPRDFQEAAQIDGASNLNIMLRIMYPLIRGTFFTVMLIYFITYWNDYQTPLLYLPSKPTIALGLYIFTFSTLNELAGEPIKLGASIIVFIPIFVLFALFQKRLIGNISMGGIKG
jgi:ABC-type glycerol-3-phosphate transport system permease component